VLVDQRVLGTQQVRVCLSSPHVSGVTLLAILFVGYFAAIDNDGVLGFPARRLIEGGCFNMLSPRTTARKRQRRQNESGRKTKDPQTKPHTLKKSPCREAPQQRLSHSMIEVLAEKANGLTSEEGNSFIGSESRFQDDMSFKDLTVCKMDCCAQFSRDAGQRDADLRVAKRRAARFPTSRQKRARYGAPALVAAKGQGGYPPIPPYSLYFCSPGDAG